MSLLPSISTNAQYLRFDHSDRLFFAKARRNKVDLYLHLDFLQVESITVVASCHRSFRHLLYLALTLISTRKGLELIGHGLGHVLQEAVPVAAITPGPFRTSAVTPNRCIGTSTQTCHHSSDAGNVMCGRYCAWQ